MKRRDFIKTGLRVAAIAMLPGGTRIRSALATDTKVHMTSGLRAATHSIPWLGTEVGIFKKRELDVTFPIIEMGASEVAAGLVRGDWEFGSFGILPVAESFLSGGDIVALLRNTLAHQDKFVGARREHTALANLAGKRVGVISDVYSGQSGIQTRLTLEKAGVTATYVRLGTFHNIYAALAKGEIDAGTLPIHMRFSGERQYGWNIFEISGLEADVPSVFATTRKLVASNRDLVMRVVSGYLETVHGFRTQPDVFVPALKRFLEISDDKVAQDLHKFYVPLFPQTPRVALTGGMPAIKSALSKKYPAVQNLQESDISDSSFIDELEQSGFIQRLYAGRN
jgi:ABC-type nitrate/sulfonate/bicarbonate transport system substrate-binding protein